MAAAEAAGQALTHAAVPEGRSCSEGRYCLAAFLITPHQGAAPEVVALATGESLTSSRMA